MVCGAATGVDLVTLWDSFVFSPCTERCINSLGLIFAALRIGSEVASPIAIMRLPMPTRSDGTLSTHQGRLRKEHQLTGF